MNPTSSLGPPPEDLQRFPAYRLGSTHVLARIHKREHGVGFFSADGSGRFDLAPPEGTCYLGEEPLASFVEVFREASVVAETLLLQKVLSLIRLRAEALLADVTQPKSRKFGVTGEIHTTTDHATTQAWAAAFRRADFGGVRYRVRHDPAQDLVGIALFGPGGAREDQFRTVSQSAIPTELVTNAEERFGIVVLPIP